MNGEAANYTSQRVSHSSTIQYAGELNFRVRYGYGCFLTALAASMSTFGLEPNSMQPASMAQRDTLSLFNRVCVRSSYRLNSCELW